MTSRERILTVLRRQQPDRVPVTIYEYSPYVADWPAQEPSYAPLLELERKFGDSFVFVPDGPAVLFDSHRLRAHEEPQSDGSVVRAVERG